MDIKRLERLLELSWQLLEVYEAFVAAEYNAVGEELRSAGTSPQRVVKFPVSAAEKAADEEIARLARRFKVEVGRDGEEPLT